MVASSEMMSADGKGQIAAIAELAVIAAGIGACVAGKKKKAEKQ